MTAVINYSMAFDSINKSEICNKVTAITQVSIKKVVDILEKFYKKGETKVNLGTPGPDFSVMKTVRQRDALSPELFN